MRGVERSGPAKWVVLMALAAASAAIPAGVGAAQGRGAGRGPDRMNVLFIAVDDLRPDLGAYGSAEAKTPNLDRLAAGGVRFERQYVQVPTCGASRFAMMTGRYPTTPAHLGNEAFVRLLPREERSEPESWAHLFRRNGYHTVAIGKVSHYPDGRVYSYTGEGEGQREMPFSWNEVSGPTGKWGTAWNAFFGYADGSSRTTRQGNRPAFEVADVPDTGYPDGVIAEAAVARLREIRDRPFVLAVGFFKPHLPFTAPKRYWDLYDRAGISLSPNPDAPAGLNPRSIHASSEMFNSYSHLEKGGAGVRIDDDHARTLRHAYLAATSYVDAQVGKVLDELDRLGLADRTIVVLWGDHGWHLGDHTVWGKHTTLERALRSPLIVRAPGAAAGRAARGLVESVDIYPTLAELCGLTAPSGLDGRSFTDLLQDPGLPGKDGARGFFGGRRTLRTDRYRITEWEEGEPRIELFDHATDPLETVNVAPQNPRVVAELVGRLR